MHWQQQQQQQQNMVGRANNMQPSSPGWGSPPNSNLPSLLDMGGNLRRSEPLLRTPPYGNRGPSRSAGLLDSPPVAYQNNQHDMLGKLDSGIDELVAAKVRLQQAMLAASADGYDRSRTSPDYQQHNRPQIMPNRQQTPWRQQQQSPQQHPYEDRRRSGGQMGRNSGGGGETRGEGGGWNGDGRKGSGGRDNRGSGGGQNRGQNASSGGGQNRGQNAGSGGSQNRGQNAARKRSSSDAYDPARPTDDDRGYTSIGRPVDDLQVTIKQQSRGRAVVDDAGPARKKPMQSPRSESKQASVDDESNKSAWFCHLCRVSCHNIKVYQIHMKGKKHLSAMEKITEVATFQSGQARKRLEAQNYLRKLEVGGGVASGGVSGGPSGGGLNNSGDNRSPRQKYCRECHKHFKGDRFDHMKSDGHKESKKKLIPRCNACNMTFKTSQKYVQHCKGDMHKLKRDQQLKEKDEGLENDGKYVTVDAVGFDDDDDMDFGPDFIEMEFGTEGGSPESEPQEQEEVVISEDEKGSSDKAETDSVIVIEDDSAVDAKLNEPLQEPKGQSVSSEQEVQEGSDQVSVSEPVDETSQSDVQVVELAAEQAPAVDTTVMKEVVQDGLDFESKPDDGGSLQVEVTSDTKKKSVSDPESGKGAPALTSDSPNSEYDMSVMVSGVGSDKEAQADQEGPAGAYPEQAQGGPTGCGVVSGLNEREESSAMAVNPTSTVSAASEHQQLKKQEKQLLQQEETKVLVFDPSKPVGEEYLVPVSGFFCKLCHKFLTSDKASRAHCKGKVHFQAVKAELKREEEAGQYSADSD